MDRRARTIGRSLYEAGAHGERVLLLFPPGLDFVCAFFGCFYAGAIAVPAYPPQSPRTLPRLLGILDDARPALALTTPGVIARVGSRFKESLQREGTRWTTLEEMETGRPDDWSAPDVVDGGLAFLQYTSGSTSTPKGVMISHANLVHNGDLIQAACGHGSDSIFVSWLPLHHDLGLIGNVLQTVHVGASCVLMAPVAFLQRPMRWLRAVSKYRGSTSGGPNFAYDLCVRKIPHEERGTLDLSSWRIAFNGAEPVRAKTLERFTREFAANGFRREAFYPCYGLAESTLMVSGGVSGAGPVVRTFAAADLERHDAVPAAPEALSATSLVSCGRPLEAESVRIVDPETLAPCPPGRVGEIWVTGPSVGLGYWGRPEESALSFSARLHADDGTSFLRTGDLGFLDAGDLFVSGRRKDLIIVRGRNLYPQDIELTVQGSHPFLEAGSGAAFSLDVDGEERLVVVQEVEIRGGTGQDFQTVLDAALRAVGEAHEVQLHEMVLVRLGAIPKTTSGKVQRRACRQAWLQGELHGVAIHRAEESRTGVELSCGELLALPPEDRPAALLSFLREAVGAAARLAPASLEPRLSLTSQGLDSLSAMELRDRLETRLQVSLSLADLLAGATLDWVADEILRTLETVSACEAPSAAMAGDACPLSHGQEALWLLHRLAPESPVYNVSGAVRCRVAPEPSALRRAFQALVERHAALRTTFGSRQGVPFLRVAAGGEVDFRREEAAEWSEDRLRRELDREALLPFDLETGPLLRVRLFAGTPGGDVLLVGLHHAVADLWSLAVLVNELGELYRQEQGGPVAGFSPLPWSYADFAVWQRARMAGGEGERLWAYWRERLRGEPPVLALPTDRPRPEVPGHRGGTAVRRMDAESLASLRGLGRLWGATLFMTLLAGFQTLLGRHAGQEDVWVGAPTMGRDIPGSRGQVGYFVNPVVLRGDLSGDPSFVDLVGQVRGTVLGAYEHQAYPFPLLTARLAPGRTSLFQAVLALQQPPLSAGPGLAAASLGLEGVRWSLGDLEVESLPIESPAPFYLTLRAAEVEGDLVLSLQYGADLFDAVTAERWLDRLIHLLAGAMGSPGTRLSGLPLLAEAERHQALREWNDTRMEGVEEPVHRQIEEQARRRPDAVAVVGDGDLAQTYGELCRRAGRLAGFLLSRGIGPEDTVGLLMERSPEAVTAALGTLMAGAAYLPLDPGSPPERLAWVMEDARIAWLLTSEELAELDSPGPGAQVYPESLAYVIYTSGSTGRPKGTALAHAGLSNLVGWHLRRYGLSPHDRTTLLAGPGFDAAVWELWTALAAGACLHVAPPAAIADPGRLAAWLEERGITQTFLPTPLAEAVLAAASAGSALRGLRLLTGGDLLRCRPPEGAPFTLINHYGPTEATVVATCAVVAPAGEPGPPPIGRPIDNVQTWVVDRHGVPVPCGVAGELWIGGGGLARAYVRRPALTAERFVPEPFSGERGARCYRTGDLVRRLPGGDLEFLGRIDRQVKLRGFRLELGEVEAALLRCPGVRAAVAEVREGRSGDRRLVAYIVPETATTPPPAALREFLARSLPEPVLPAVFVPLPALPLTANGKIDRAALPAPPETAGGAAPGTPLEELLAGIWKEVLGVDGVRAGDDFFALGGHSLLAAQVAARVRESCSVELPLRRLFQAPTLAALAEEVAAARREGSLSLPPVTPAGRDRDLPPSFAQERLWFLARLAPEAAAYNIAGALRLDGPLRVPGLSQALSAVVARHESLRTCFLEREGRPFQAIAAAWHIPLPVVDLERLAAAEGEAARRMNEEARRPFDLARGPLLRLVLWRLGSEEHALLLVMHHAVADGWSVGVFLRELSALYAAACGVAAPPLPELPVQYADFVLWQRAWLSGEVLERHLAYWRERLRGAPEALSLWTDRPRPPVQTFRGTRLPVRLPGGLARGLRRLAVAQGATLFMVLAAGFQILLSRYAGQPDIVLGTPIAHRDRTEVEGLIGCFADTLVLRGELAGDPAFTELLARTRAGLLADYDHRDLPFEKLVEALVPVRQLGSNPLFQVLLTLQNLPPAAPDLPGLAVEIREVDTGSARFDLALTWTESGVEGEDSLAGTLEYATDLFDRATVLRLLGHLETLLAALPGQAAGRVSELPLLTAAEESQLLARWHAVGPELPDLRLHELVEAQARRTPDAVAVEADGQLLTYGELDRRSDDLARRLRLRGAGPEEVVAVGAGRSPALLTGLLGILRAGAAYLPLDPAQPRQRLAAMLADSQARIVVAEGAVLSHLPVEGLDVVSLEEGSEAGLPRALASWPRPAADSPCYLLYTSGSTGHPKGILVRHSAAVAFLLAMAREPGLGRDDVLLAVTTPAFDISVLELFLPLSVGARVALASREETRDGRRLAGRLQELAATVLQATPSTWRLLVESGWEGEPGLRALSGGESLPPDLAAALLARCTVLWNLYGPTETTVWSAALRVEGVAGPVPVGGPVAGDTLHVLDPHLRPVPVGVPGQLFIGGAGLARGYLRRPDLTAAVFVPAPFTAAPGSRLYATGDLVRRRADENLDFLGRIDHQVKIRGHRVEPAEVEAALLSHPGVHAAAVTVREERPGDRCLVAYVVGDPPPGREELRAFLRQRLPEPMVPAAVVTLAGMPLTPGGKLDRQALPSPEPEPSPVEPRGPRTPVEELLAGIWAEVLGLERCGIHESFFDLGGHSLLAMQVVSRLRSILGVELPVRLLFEQPTVAALAEWVETASRTPLPPLVPRSRTMDPPLSHAQERLWFIDRLEPGNPVYNAPLTLRLRGRLAAQGLAAALAVVAQRHEALRATFAESAGRPVQKISATARFPLAVADLSGLPPAMRQTEATRQALVEARRPFDLAAGPLCRALLLRLDGEEHLFVLNVHHIVFDGWSAEVLLRELGLLHDVAPLPPLPVQYADFALWQRQWLGGGALAEQLDFWRRQFTGASVFLDLPTDRRRPALQTFRGGAETVRLSAELVHDLRALGRRRGATLFMTVLAGWSAVLHRVSGAPEVLVGTPVANRRRSELEGLIGLFVNTLPLRVTGLAADPPFTELLDRVRETVLAAYENQDVPFERLVEGMGGGRDLSRSTVLQVMLALTDGAPPTLRLSGVTAEEVLLHNGTAKLELLLALSVAEGGVAGGLEFNSDLFDVATARRLADQLARLLLGAAAGPERQLGDLPLLAAAEERQILVDWNATAAPFPRDLGLHELFEEQAARAPQAIAVVHGERQISYAMLDAWADHIARHLRTLGVGPEVLVGVFCGRTPAMLAAVFGVLKAGGAYLPLDPAYPANRLAFLLADASAPVVLCEEGVAAALPAFAGKLVPVDGSSGHRPGQPGRGEAAPRGFLHPAQAAYAIYTSGSTGAPKGVLVRHGSAVARITWALSVYSPERLAGVLAATSLSFDLSVFEIFVPLAAGGTVILADDPMALPDLPAASAVTLVNTVPSAMAELVRTGALPGSVQGVNLAGEPLRRDLAARLYALPGVKDVYNLYGPSEDTTYSTGARVEQADEREPAIGRPLSNTRVYLLDPGLRPVPVGTPGEIWLGGEGVARGYLRRPDLTADRFRPDPFGPPAGRLYRTGDLARLRADGAMDYLGRLDQQVKVRGLRIEPGEIEGALLSHPQVLQAAVAVREVARAKALVAYVVCQETRPSGTELREHLRQRLPEPMIPAFFVPLPELPLTPNGKVDRRTLPSPEPEPSASELTGPRTAAEEELVRIWKDVLGVERVGVHDNFFALGGDSLLSLQIAALARRAGFAVTARLLFQRPTVAALAAAAAPADCATDEEDAPGPVPLTPIQRWFFEGGSLEPHHYNQAVLFETAVRVDPARLRHALDRVERRHGALRLRFRRGAGGWEQESLPPGSEAPFVVADLSALPAPWAEEAARRVLAAAQASLDLEAGPIHRMALLDLGPGRSGRLHWAAHHLAVDAVSWRILVEDLCQTYEALAAGTLPELPARTSAYRRWSERLASHAGSPELAEERTQWLQRPWDRVRRLPVDVDGGPGSGTAATERTAARTLDAETTRALLQDVPQVYNTQINDALLTAVARAFRAWTHSPVLLVDLESHGRQELFPDLDLSRTVGWFTSLFPVLLELPAGGVGEALRAIKEQLRRVPRGGSRYGLLRYGTALGRELAALPQAQVGFNYLGRLDAALPGPPLAGVLEDSGPAHGPRTPRRHLLEIQGAVLAGRLRLTCSYCEGRHRRSTVENLLDGMQAGLVEIIGHCRSVQEGGYTPSDFPLARLSQAQIDRIMTARRSQES